MKTNMGVLVLKFTHNPRAGLLHRDAQFFMQLTGERLSNRFGGFKLAARKLPPARIGLARWPLRKQHPALTIVDNADGDLNNGPAHGQFS
jgi:hypothetical protein